MKGFLVWHQRAFAKTHLLLEIADPRWRIDPTLRPALEPALDLSDYAWKYRYPGEGADPTRAEAQEAIRLAQAVFSAIRDRLPAEVRPY